MKPAAHIGPKATARVAQVRRLRIEAAMLILTDYCAWSDESYRSKASEVRDILRGSKPIDRTVGGDLVLDGQPIHARMSAEAPS